MRAIILKAASHHIPTGKHKINTEPVPAEILELTKERDELRQRDHTSPELQRLYEEITRTTSAHKQAKGKQFVETMDHKTDSSKLWRTIKAIDGKSTPTAENEAECGVKGKRRLCDLNVTNPSPALATRHIRCVLLVNSPNKLNLLSWLLIYLCNK